MNLNIIKDTIKNILFSSMAVIILVAASCGKSGLSSANQEIRKHTYTCTIGNEDSRVAVSDNGKVSWKVGDVICVHNGASAYEMITLKESDISNDGKSATITTSVADSGDPDRPGVFASCPGEKKPEGQGSYYDACFITNSNQPIVVAQLSGTSFAMKNSQGVITFSVSGDYDSYEFSGNGDETIGYEILATRAQSNKEGRPYDYRCKNPLQKITGPISNGKASIWLTIKYTGEPDKKLILDLNSGFTIKFFKGGECRKVVVTSKAVSLHRNEMLALGDVTSHLKDYVPGDEPIWLSVDYRNQWDTLRVLSNPHKGWYHHYYSNGTWNYGLTSEEDVLLKSFPGMDHIYLRLAWSYFEKKEGVYDWSLIDNIVNKYVPMGYGISLRITCHETGGCPGAVGQNVGGRNYATPYWVRQAGAKGTDIPKGESTAKCWCPDYGDPVFLEKLENFHKALAARYDGKPWLRYVDVGSMGDWGEGHTSFSINQMIPDDVVKKHFDIYDRCYKKTPVVAMENSMSYKRENEPNWGTTHSTSIEDLMNYAYSKGFGLRCDSYMVDWYIKIGAAKWAIMRPYMYEKFYRDRLIVHESEHYDHVIEAGNWSEPEGEGYVEKAKCTGRELFVNSMILTHPTYIGYHGHLKKWLSDNPKLAAYLANKCGYWLIPVSAEVSDDVLTVKWLNNGVAPCLHEYALRLHFFNPLGEETVVEIPESGNMAWMPGEISQKSYTFSYPESVKGQTVRLYMELYDYDTERTIDVGLCSGCLFRNYIPLGEIDFK